MDTKFEKGKYYKSLDWRPYVYCKVLDIKHPDKQYPEHTVYHLFEIRTESFEKSEYMGAYSSVRFGKSQTLQDGEGFKEISFEDYEQAKENAIKEILKMTEPNGSYFLDRAVFADMNYYKILDTPTFTNIHAKDPKNKGNIAICISAAGKRVNIFLVSLEAIMKTHLNMQNHVLKKIFIHREKSLLKS